MEKEVIVTPGAENTAPAAEEVTSLNGEVAEPAAAPSEEAMANPTAGMNATNEEDNSASDSGGAGFAGDADGDSKASRRAEFEQLIKGEYKEFYEERLKDNLSRRFKERAEEKQQNMENSRIVGMLFDKYNVKDGDIRALVKAIESDDAYLAEEARKRGISTEDYKYMRRLESENRRYRNLSDRYEAMDRANKAVEKWYLESEQLKEIYPDFNIFEESKNKSFVSLVQSGIDVKTAYEAVHHSELVSKAAMEAARTAEIKAAEAIKQRAMRPAENGLSSQSSAIIKSDVSKLSPGERAEIARRVSRGERITF